MIDLLKNEEGFWMSNRVDIDDCFICQFKELFSSSNPSFPAHLEDLLPSYITYKDNLCLCAIPDDIEIREVLFRIGFNKAPGPNDDLFILCRASNSSVIFALHYLETYGSWLGQSVNMDKSLVHYSKNFGGREAGASSFLLNFCKVDATAIYLGLPLFMGISKKQSFNSIVERIHSRINGWKSRTLSQAGRATLIRSVASAILTYTMSTFNLPKENIQVPSDDIRHCTKQSRIEINVEDLPFDPGLRKKISDYHPNDRDEIRLAYLQRGPCQPSSHEFPQKSVGVKLRRLPTKWLEEFGDWLEYSVSKDAVFCLYCYLMGNSIGGQGGGDAFTRTRFSCWGKKKRLGVHVGSTENAHNNARRMCEDLMNQKQHVEVAFSRPLHDSTMKYRIRLTATIDCIRFLLRQGLAFRGHNESEDSINRGNFLELLTFLAKNNEEVDKVVLKNAPKNLKVIAHGIQKHIVRCAASATTNVILNDLGHDLFSVLVDESRDVSTKEQMAVMIRFVNKKGCVVERFLSLVHVSNTTALSLKEAINSLFARHNLTLVAVAKDHNQVASHLNDLARLVNVVGASCKRQDHQREKQANMVREAIDNGELASGRGLNQESSLQRAGDTRWGSHYASLTNLKAMFSSVIDVLEVIEEDGGNSDQKGEATSLLNAIQSFEFMFIMHLMIKVLGITNELSQALQKKDQEVVNAMGLVKGAKELLQIMRDDG
ncbi:hypothetical protein L1049_028092 [Liquidambar formosana]|uniref:TTF-type domain-containing protein n=1 Tax=Liquidambar formosana TaxID=63359 RepID=A0AAP0RJN7_LIQFO